MSLCDELEQTIQQNQKYTQDLLQVALKEILNNHKQLLLLLQALNDLNIRVSFSCYKCL